MKNSDHANGRLCFPFAILNTVCHSFHPFIPAVFQRVFVVCVRVEIVQKRYLMIKKRSSPGHDQGNEWDYFSLPVAGSDGLPNTI